MPPDTSARRLRELHEDLELYPEDRGEVALDLAMALKHAGDRAAARQWLRESIAHGGLDGGMARSELVELCLEDGDADGAAAELEQIRKLKPYDPAIFEYVAQMFEERGEPWEALRWYDMVAARLTDEELLDAADGEPLGGSFPLLNRRRLRRALGLPPDNLDRLLPPDDQ